MGEIEVEEDSRDDGRIGQKREDLHLGAAGGTHERQHVVDAREQDGPADSGRGGANSGAGSRDMAGEAGVYPGRRRAGHALGPTECHDARPQPGPAGPPPTPDRSSWTPREGRRAQLLLPTHLAWVPRERVMAPLAEAPGRARPTASLPPGPPFGPQQVSGYRPDRRHQDPRAGRVAAAAVARSG